MIALIREEIQKIYNYVDTDVDLGYLRFSVKGQRIAGIYADKNFFWLDTGPVKWKGTKITDEQILTDAIRNVKATVRSITSAPE